MHVMVVCEISCARNVLEKDKSRQARTIRTVGQLTIVFTYLAYCAELSDYLLNFEFVKPSRTNINLSAHTCSLQIAHNTTVLNLKTWVINPKDD